jgi:hypothetical protein
MNKKKLMNGLRAGLSFQQICEIEGCTRKAEYCITQYHGPSIRVCTEHLPNTDIIKGRLEASK